MVSLSQWTMAWVTRSLVSRTAISGSTGSSQARMIAPTWWRYFGVSFQMVPSSETM